MEVLVVQEIKMLKYITLGLLAASSAVAQEQGDITRHPCGSFQEARSILQSTGQDMLWKGRGTTLHISGEQQTPEVVFHVNQETGAWSLVSLYPGNIACLVMTGWGFEPHSVPTKKIEKKSP